MLLKEKELLAGWWRPEGRVPKYYHTDVVCLLQIDELEGYTEATREQAEGLGMEHCPSCIRETHRREVRHA